MAQKPCAFKGDPQSAMQLVRANAFLAGADKMHSSQPIAHSDMAILENGPDFNGKFLPACITLVEANPFTLQGTRVIDSSTMRTIAPIRPNARLDIGISSSFVIEVRASENGFSHGKTPYAATIYLVVGPVKYNIAIRRSPSQWPIVFVGIAVGGCHPDWHYTGLTR